MLLNMNRLPFAAVDGKMHVFIKPVRINLTGASHEETEIPVRILPQGFLIKDRGGDIHRLQSAFKHKIPSFRY